MKLENIDSDCLSRILLYSYDKNTLINQVSATWNNLCDTHWWHQKILYEYPQFEDYIFQNPRESFMKLQHRKCLIVFTKKTADILEIKIEEEECIFYLLQGLIPVSQACLLVFWNNGKEIHKLPKSAISTCIQWNLTPYYKLRVIFKDEFIIISGEYERLDLHQNTVVRSISGNDIHDTLFILPKIHDIVCRRRRFSIFSCNYRALSRQS